MENIQNMSEHFDNISGIDIDTNSELDEEDVQDFATI